MFYDLESLREINSRYCGHPHSLTQSDVAMANGWVKTIENERVASNIGPLPGDTVRLTERHGDYYRHALIEKVEEGDAHVCENAYVPFLFLRDDGSVGMSASGGAWLHLPTSELKYVGKERRTFCDWGSCGPCADGAVDFEAEVNVWEYRDKNPLYGDFSTENYDKFYIYHREEEKDGSPYHYLGDGFAFRTEQEYLAWLTTYHGVEFQGAWENQAVVFTYRKSKHFITKEEWDELALPVDTRRCNGDTILVKIDEEHDRHMIHEYRYSNSGNVTDWRFAQPYHLALKAVYEENIRREIRPVVYEL